MKHWSSIKEKGSFFGLRFTLWSYRILGRRITYFIMYNVMVFYFILSYQARKSSFNYIQHYNPNIGKFKLWMYSFRHFLSFGAMLIDKFAVWNKSILIDDIEIDQATRERLDNAVKNKQGGMIFTAHFGNLEVARALSRYDSEIKINALVFSEHAQTLNNLLAKINPEYNIGMYSLREPTPQLAIELYEKVQKGEFIVITGDRTSVTKVSRSLTVEFMGDVAQLPEGAFILASLLKSPCYLMLCPKISSSKFKLIFDDFTEKGIVLERKQRQEQLQKYAQQYIQTLEGYCREYPLQWFNFFDFWYSSEDKSK